MNSNLASLLLPNKAISYASLKEEQKMCVEFANGLRQMTLEGKLPYVWFHIANEFLPSRQVNYSFELKLKHMGKLAGLADYCFVGPNGGFFIEFKSLKGKQTESQKKFEEWCQMMGIGYYVCRSAKEGFDTLSHRFDFESDTNI
jgi:hypothetical protein